MPVIAEICPYDTFECGSMFPGEVEASVGDFPIAIHLGLSQLTAARFTESENLVLISKIEANQGWKDFTTRRATMICSPNVDPDLLQTFLPTLEQIIQAVATKVRRLHDRINNPPSLLPRPESNDL